MTFDGNPAHPVSYDGINHGTHYYYDVVTRQGAVDVSVNFTIDIDTFVSKLNMHMSHIVGFNLVTFHSREYSQHNVCLVKRYILLRHLYICMGTNIYLVRLS